MQLANTFLAMEAKSLHRSGARDGFKGFVEALARELGIAPDMLPQKAVCEIPAGNSRASVAIDQELGFAAAQWIAIQDGQAAVHEVFFVTPAKKEPQLGFRISGSSPALGCLDWWRELDGSVPTEAPVPSFLELTALLASKGQSLTSRAETSEKVRELTSEVAYLQMLLLEQSEELRQSRSAARHFRSFADRVVGAAPEKSSTPIQDDLSDIPDWCARHEGEIIVLPRARNGIKKSIYEDPAMILTGLGLLAGPYRQHRMGNLSKPEFEELLLASGLRLQGSVGASIAGEQGDSYFVNWAGRRRFLDMHLLKGGGRDERYCLRIYFFWDADSQRAIVGSAPAHLDNSLS